MGILPLALGTLLFSADAQAGGVGLLTTAGTHQIRTYYYRDDGEQGIDNQTRPNFGVGGEAILGDKDDRIQGMMRMYVMRDLPPTAPDLSNENTTDYGFTFPAEHEKAPSDIGTLQVGVQWGMWGDPSTTQIVLNSLIGSGFATTDNLEFFLAEMGGGVTHVLNETMQAHASLALNTRFRKRVYMGVSGFAGVRYMFD
jgi:hypothetical protein